MCSYQVPKEVGKVGTESASFIEPITNRKDGIEAMFSKQKILSSQPSSSLGKREYDSFCSPPRLSKELESSDLKQNPSSPGKRSKSNHNDERETVSLQYHSTNLSTGLIIRKAKTQTSTSSKVGKKLKVIKSLHQINLQWTYHTTEFAIEAESKSELILSTLFPITMTFI